MTHAQKYLQQINSNPIIQGIERPLTAAEWIEKLGHDPLSPDDFEAAREEPATVVNLLDTIFAPTLQLSSIAAALHRLLWDSYAARDPRYVTPMGARRAVPPDEAPILIPIRPRGTLLQGITGLGKSTLIEKVLKLFPQVIDRGDTIPGRKCLKQLLYIVVPMPQAASTSAFVQALAEAIDNVLGTNYLSQLKGRVVQSDFRKLRDILRSHYCGVVIIEENQEGNKLTGQQHIHPAARAPGTRADRKARKNISASFSTFFMDIMNAGMALWLVGNPLAFEQLLTSSQITSRLGSNCFYLHPALHAQDESWVEDYVSSIWGATCLPKPDEPYENLRVKLFQKSGGFHHILVQMRKAALLSALLAGADRVRVADIEVALALDLGEEGKIATAFANHDEGVLAEANDIPEDVYVNLWQAMAVAAAKSSNDIGARKDSMPNSARPASGEQVGDKQPDQPSAARKSETPKGAEKTTPQPVPRARRTPKPPTDTAFDANDLRSGAALRSFQGQLGESAT
jgi:hypothetical protein